jgi:protein TonB
MASAPTWLQRPEPTYPREAIRAGVEQGEVDLQCVARADGQMAFCTITSETPEGYGFGREALRATRDARMQPGEVDGERVDASVHFSVHFRLQ